MAKHTTGMVLIMVSLFISQQTVNGKDFWFLLWPLSKELVI
ncbi:MAG: hypothetical protein ACLVJN_06640 [Streptococcus parasanguinis]